MDLSSMVVEAGGGELMVLCHSMFDCWKNHSLRKRFTRLTKELTEFFLYITFIELTKKDYNVSKNILYNFRSKSKPILVYIVAKLTNLCCDKLLLVEYVIKKKQKTKKAKQG